MGIRVRILAAQRAGKAGCALHPRSRVQRCTRKRTQAYRFSGNTPAFPARWVTAYFALSPVTGLSCHRRFRGYLRKSLAPASGRQDHTTSPSASSAVRLAHVSAPPPPASTASLPAFVTTRDPPLVRMRWGELVRVICPTREAEYFWRADWTAQITLRSLANFVFPRIALNGSSRVAAALNNSITVSHAIEHRAARPCRIARIFHRHHALALAHKQPYPDSGSTPRKGGPARPPTH
jgi:hypothetical protein